MSTEPGFSTLTFPSLRSPAQGDRDERARAGGYAAGYAAGLRAAEVEVAARIAALEAETAAALIHARARTDHAVSVLASATAALHARTVPVLETAHTTIAESAMLIAEAVIASELSDGGVAAKSALYRALSSVDVGVVHTVRMNPLDLGALDAETIAAAGVTLTPDPLLARGDAVTVFPDGYLDARIGTALARARAAIEEARS